MKHTYSAPLAMLLLAAAPALASNFHPLRPGTRAEYRQTGAAGDTTFAVAANVAASHPQRPDSLYELRGRTIAVLTRGTGPCQNADYRLGTGLFGQQERVRNPGSYQATYELTGTNGRVLVLRPRAALGQSWAAMPGLTAQVVARGVGTVLGQPDSVVTIGFSDGQVLRIGKQYGYLSGPALGHYLDPRTPARQIALAAWNGLGTAATGPKVIFDFQPGDVFVRRYRQETQQQFVCTERWTRDSVMSRRVSGDSVIYRIWQRSFQRGYGQAGAPGGFCSATGSYLSAPTISTLAVTASSPAAQAQPTGTFLSDGIVTPAGTRGTLVFPASRSSALYNGRFQHRTMLRNAPSGQAGDSLCLGFILDFGQTTTYAAGLGMVKRSEFTLAGPSETTLLGYTKSTPNGIETYGQLPRFAQLLPTRAATRPAASTAAFPSPFASELIVAFALARPQAVALELRDALGRVVLAQEAAALAAGPQRLTLGTAALPAGLYTLHLRFAGEARSEVLKVVKGQ